MTPEDHANDNGHAEQPHGHGEPGSPEDYPPVIVGHEDLGTAVQELHERLNNPEAHQEEHAEAHEEAHEGEEEHGGDGEHAPGKTHEHPKVANFFQQHGEKLWEAVKEARPGGIIKEASLELLGAAVAVEAAAGTLGIALPLGAGIINTVSLGVFGTAPISAGFITGSIGFAAQWLVPAGLALAAPWIIVSALQWLNKLMGGSMPKFLSGGDSHAASEGSTHH